MSGRARLAVPGEIVLASSNQGKIDEFRRLFAPHAIRITPQSELGVRDTPEPFSTFLENALAKARHASRVTQQAALADDSGLCVDALAGAPGVHSARFAGEPKSDVRNNLRLVAELRDVALRTAHYYCVLVLLRHADDPQPIVAEGFWMGSIVLEARGQAGFGYDPHFYVPEFGRTAAELTAAEKNRVSHRGAAIRALLERLG